MLGRRNFLELAGAAGLGSVSAWKDVDSDTDWDSDMGRDKTVGLIVVAPGTGEHMVRILNNSSDVVTQWCHTVEEPTRVFDGGEVPVQSLHASVDAESPDSTISSVFIWLDAISNVVVDFCAETVRLVYSGTQKETYWLARRRFDIHRKRMIALLTQAQQAESDRSDELWAAARAERDYMHEMAKRALDECR